MHHATLRNVIGGVFFAFCGIAFAGAGSVDTMFGTDGVFNQTGAAIKGITVQGDGKILMAGAQKKPLSSYAGFGLLRLSANGVIDSTFGTNGLDVISIGQNAEVGGMAVSPVDGKVIVVGTSSGFNFDVSPPTFYSKFAVARYNIDGTLDTNFNITGVAESLINSKSCGANCVAVQSDGGVIAAGYSRNTPSDMRFALARYVDGALDPNFNSAGTVVTDPGSYSVINAIAISPTDGKIIVAGQYQNPSNYKIQWLIARYNTNGSLDTGFDTDGLVFSAASGYSNYTRAIALQADGKILVAGSISTDSNADDFAIRRYNTDGSLDTTFGSEGLVSLDVAGGYDSINHLTILADGRILAGGTAGGATVSSFAILMLNSDGSLDTSFGTSGKVVTTGDTSRDLKVMTLQAGGKVIAAGEFFGVSPAPGQSAAVRYNLLADVVDPPPVRKTDLSVGLTSAAALGANVYNSTGTGQSQGITITSGATSSVFIKLQNDGTAADSFKIKATAGDANFTVTYFKGKQNVTAALVAGTYNTGTLAPGVSQSLKATIKAKTLLGGKSKTLSIAGSSLAESTAADKVLIKAKSKAKPK